MDRILRLPRSVLVIMGVVVLAGIAALAVLFGLFERSVVSAAVETPLSREKMAELAPRGRYLAQAADCAACHTAPGGAPYAGGLAFPMPIGTLNATNISPDVETGIGGWSRADFHRAVRDGVAPHGRRLYPAMPYTSYRQLTEEDTDAIYAFLMTREPIRQENRGDSFPYPYVRPFMAFWNLLNLSGQGAVDDASKSKDWNRGRYLVDALGHCGECHTPRNITMATIGSRYLQGTSIEGVDAPDITSNSLVRFGFDHASLAAYMRTGVGAQGVMSFGMFDVVHNSTRYLTEADAAAMSRYLLGETPAAVTAPTPVAIDESVKMAGRQVYVATCAGCHGVNGEGTPRVAPPMSSNISVRLPGAHNLLVAMLDGLPAREYPDGEARQAMPGFRGLLTDQQIADLANYMRATWGGVNPDVTVQAVSQVSPRQ